MQSNEWPKIHQFSKQTFSTVAVIAISVELYHLNCINWTYLRCWQQLFQQRLCAMIFSSKFLRLLVTANKQAKQLKLKNKNQIKYTQLKCLSIDWFYHFQLDFKWIDWFCRCFSPLLFFASKYDWLLCFLNQHSLTRTMFWVNS